MVFNIGDNVHAVSKMDNIDDYGIITNIKPDAVSYDYEVTFQDKSKHHFYRFQLTKIN